MTTDNQGVIREEKQRQIDIKNLRFYARLFLEHHWETLQISSGVFQQTLKEIADRLESSENDKAESMIAHRWFAARFGEIMNGRDFSVKCAIASQELFDLHQRHEKTIADLREQLAGKAITQAHSLALDTIDRLQEERDSLRTQLQQTQDVARELLGLTKRMRDGYMNLAEFHRVSGSTRLSLRDYIIDSDKLTARAQSLLGPDPQPVE